MTTIMALVELIMWSDYNTRSLRSVVVSMKKLK